MDDSSADENDKNTLISQNGGEDGVHCNSEFVLFQPHRNECSSTNMRPPPYSVEQTTASTDVKMLVKEELI